MDNRRTSPPQSTDIPSIPCRRQSSPHNRYENASNKRSRQMLIRFFITGETGTGKEVVAREIHFQASSEEQPFVAVNCSALPEVAGRKRTLWARQRSVHRCDERIEPATLRLANNGTLFLDEIADLPLHIQAKLLRVLDTRTLRRIGGAQEIPFQERIISAFNRDPVPIIKSGQFRSDLYYRLNVFPIHLNNASRTSGGYPTVS